MTPARRPVVRSLVVWGALFAIGVGCGASRVPVSQPPCTGAGCGDLCPAGTRIDWNAYGAAGCEAGQPIEVAGVRTECAVSNGASYVCLPIVGSDVCGGKGIESITRSEVVCSAPEACSDGQTICASESQYLACHGGAWSPPAMCPIDTACHDGACVARPQLDCARLAPFKACGGDLQGKWTITGACLTIDSGGCPRDDLAVWGRISFDEARRVTEASIGSRDVATFAASCPDIDIQCRMLSDMPVNDPRWPRCVRDARGCVCTREDVITLAKDIAVPEDGYCRRGEVLDLFLSQNLRIRLVREP